MANIYKVSNDEWEEIMGEGQIREFALSQVQNYPDDFIEENINQVDNKDKDKLLDVVRRIEGRNFFAHDLTAKEVGLILTERCFDIEKLNVY